MQLSLIERSPLLAVPPEILQVPEDQTVGEGEDVLLQCQVYGNPLPAVTWYRGERKHLAFIRAVARALV